ncbi:hypothetical protein ACFLR1_03930 [Bacteroidota bacterium]
MYLIALVVAAISVNGCKDEVGCTDRTADNYNPDAVRSDESCISSRNKFTGTYSVLHICWPDTLLPLPREMQIVADSLREVKDDVQLLNFGTDSLRIKALVTKSQLRIPRQGVSVHGYPLSFSGEGHIDDNGYLTIVYSAWLLNGDEVLKECVIFAQKLEN